MKKQTSFIIPWAITLLLIAGCDSGLPTGSQAVQAQATPTSQSAIPTAGNQPSDASPAPTDVLAQATIPPTAVAAAIDSPTDEPVAIAPTEPPTPEAVTAPSPTLPQASQQSRAGSGDVVQAIFSSMSAVSAVKSYRIKLTTPKDAPGSTEIIEVLNPGRTHEIASEGGNVTLELIGIGNNIYSKNGKEAWQKIPVTAKTQAFIDSQKANSSSIDAFRKSITDAQVVGPEDLDGTPTMVYQYSSTETVTTPGGPSITTRVAKLWVAVSDGLPRKTGVDLTSQFGGKSHETKVTSTYYDYNADIKIEAPIP